MTSSTSIAAWVERNVAVVRQGIDVLASIDHRVYTLRHPEIGAAGIGEHVRHCHDFYECFLAGIESGTVDYDARRRPAQLEVDREHAIERLESVCVRLRELDAASRTLQVRLDAPDDDEAWASSTVERELQFLASHTVHHFTVVAFKLRLEGVEVAPEFGVAPSTLHHSRQSGTGGS